ncbi:hypothetical protein KFE94_05495 [bacterium SCSIO 12643]|nr:hypothetical protein KFE94_05495 [bacterium SCSIO 12643]
MSLLNSDLLKGLTPFFNFKIENFEDLFSLVLGVLIFVIVVFHGITLDMTYDEAYTYLHTGRIQDFWGIFKFEIANTHILNSLLMTVTTLFFPYNDFAIRLPAILIAGFYISVALSISKQFKNRLIFLGLLFGFFYFTWYLSLARGYGMCAAFLLAAVYVHKNKQQFHNWYLWMANFFLLSIYSNFVAIPIVCVFSIYIWVVDFKFLIPRISRSKWIRIITLFAISIFAFFLVTRGGRPLYGAYDIGFFKAIPYDLVSRFIDSSNISEHWVVIGTLGLVFLSLGTFLVTRAQKMYGVILISTLVLIIGISWIGNKPLPTGRVLIPFWPLIVLLIIEILDYLTESLRISKKVVLLFNVLFLVVFMINFSNQTYFSNLYKDKLELWRKPLIILADYDKDIYPFDTYYFPHDRYVLEKDLYHGLIQKKLSQMKPSFVMEKNGVKWSGYDQLRVVAFDFNRKPYFDRFYRKVYKTGELIYEDEWILEYYLYKSGNQMWTYLSYPSNVDGDKIVLIPNNCDWSIDIDIR